jgi:hypothetical protein
MGYMLLLALFGQFLFAQHPDQPQKLDLGNEREVLILFKIKDINSKLDYTMERNQDYDHALKLSSGDGHLKHVTKIDKKVAKAFDDDFSKIFFKINYELERPRESCEMVYKISLRSESLNICDIESEKVNLVNTMVEKLKPRLKI